MRVPQACFAGSMFLAAVVIPAWVGYGLGRGTSDPHLTVLAALGIAGCAGYALGHGASSLR